MKSIAFIGMPGCGKSTIARLTAEALNLPFADSDERIEAYFGMPISDIFPKFGEAEFRLIESDIVEDIVTIENLVISLGGGAVLRNEAIISANCSVVYLQRGIDAIYESLLAEAGQRPLVKTREDLQATFEARRDIYERAANFTVANNGSTEDAVKSVLEELRKCGY
ncbi:MAG: shikimate kinase [Oscillospiraceae bacterium]|jgi:shikimate kinase|nr:shikimate kinase [Oscillospiraceae bacterium]